MAKISRITQLIFGSSAGLNQISEFGSLAAGTPAFTTSPATVQGLSNYLTGWFGAVLMNNSPAIEDLNAVCFLYAYQLAYLMQAGVAEYDAATVYYTNSLCTSGSNIYISLVDANTGNTPASSPSSWKVLSANPLANLGDMAYGAANGVPTQLAGQTSTARAFLTQTGTGSASAAPVWQVLSRNISSTSGSSSLTLSASLQNITNQTRTIATQGGSVLINWQPTTNGSGTQAILGLTGTSGQLAIIYLLRNSVVIASYTLQITATGATGVQMATYPCFTYLDTSVINSPATYTYSLQASGSIGATLATSNLSLSASEL